MFGDITGLIVSPYENNSKKESQINAFWVRAPTEGCGSQVWMLYKDKGFLQEISDVRKFQSIFPRHSTLMSNYSLINDYSPNVGFSHQHTFKFQI